MSKAEIESSIYMDDHTALMLARMFLKMKERYLSTPEQKEAYKRWHMEEYGYLPSDEEI